MGTLLDLASLVTIPSGYKVGTVYSVVPTDGAGDLTFTRSNDTASRVGPNGLIEKVRTNVILQSNTFNTTWLPSDATTTSGATAPDGTATAWTLANTAASGIIQQAATLAGLRSVSIYAKQGTHRYLYMGVYVGAGTQSYQVFDLQNGVIPSGTKGRIESVGNGWYRCTSFGADGTTGGVQIFPSNNPSGAGTTNGSILIWRCQYESGDIATDYIPTTTTAVSVGPVANLPRLDYLNSTCPNLLLEPQRTNNLVYSEQFNNAAWATDGNGAGETKTANYAISPDGYQDADRIQLNRTGGSYSRVRQDYVAAGTHTGSVYLKSNTGSSQKIWMRIDGTVSTKITITTSWQRFVVSGSTSAAIELFIDNTDAEIATIADFLAWGAQVELGAFATSYIPTLGAASTRGADSAFKTGITSLIGQTEGTIFFDGIISGAENATTNIINSEKNVSCSFYMQRRTASNQIGVGFIFSGTTTAELLGGTIAIGQRFKAAWGYKSGSNVLSINGVIVATSAATYTIPSTFDDLFFNDPTTYFSFQEAEKFNEVILFKTRLSNAELAQLTTL
jgi:hypothetical protein